MNYALFVLKSLSEGTTSGVVTLRGCYETLEKAMAGLAEHEHVAAHVIRLDVLIMVAVRKEYGIWEVLERRVNPTN